VHKRPCNEKASKVIDTTTNEHPSTCLLSNGGDLHAESAKIQKSISAKWK